MEYLLGICLIIISIVCFLMWNKNQELNLEIKELKKSGKTEELEKKAEENLKSLENLTKIKPGDKCVYSENNLSWTEDKEKKYFDVTYEAEILEVSADKVKLKAIDFRTSDVRANGTHKKPMMNYLENKWVSKDKIDVIIRPDMRREVNLNKILND